MLNGLKIKSCKKKVEIFKIVWYNLICIGIIARDSYVP